MPIRIVIADDHNILRSGLSAILSSEPGLEVVGEADSGEQALNLADDLKPDIVVMDLSMPGMGGIEATRLMTIRHPQIRVLILTMHDDKGMLKEALRAGASGYILKRAVKSELVSAIQVVLKGDLYVHPALTRLLLAEIDGLPARPRFEEATLTLREIDVLRLIARGYTNSQIAQALSISIRTVEFHRGKLMDKLNANSRVDLVRYASEHGFTDENGAAKKYSSE